MASPHWADELKRAILGRGIPRAEVVLTVIAAVDIVLLSVRRDLDFVAANVADAILWFDRAVVALFAIDYVVSLARARDRAGFFRSTWYDLIGLIPLPIALFRFFLLVRIPHVFLTGTRDPGRAAELGGAGYFLKVFRRYEPVIVEEVTDPLLVKLLQIVREAIAKGRYMEAMGLSLDARRARIHAVMLKSLREKAPLRLALSAPPAEAAVRALADELTDVVVTALTDPDLDAVVKESIDAGLARLQARFAEKDRVAAPARVEP